MSDQNPRNKKKKKKMIAGLEKFSEKSFSNLAKDRNLQISEAEQYPKRINQKKSMLKYTAY